MSKPKKPARNVTRLAAPSATPSLRTTSRPLTPAPPAAPIAKAKPPIAPPAKTRPMPAEQAVPAKPSAAPAAKTAPATSGGFRLTPAADEAPETPAPAQRSMFANLFAAFAPRPNARSEDATPPADSPETPAPAQRSMFANLFAAFMPRPNDRPAPTDGAPAASPAGGYGTSGYGTSGYRTGGFSSGGPAVPAVEEPPVGSFWAFLPRLAWRPSLANVRRADTAADRQWLTYALILGLAVPLLTALLPDLLLLAFHNNVPTVKITAGGVAINMLEEVINNVGTVLIITAGLLLFTTPLNATTALQDRLARLLRPIVLVNAVVQVVAFLANLVNTATFIVFGRDIAIEAAAPNPPPAHPTAAQQALINAANAHAGGSAAYALLSIVLTAFTFGYTASLFIQGGAVATGTRRLRVAVIVVTAVFLFNIISGFLLAPLNR